MLATGLVPAAMNRTVLFVDQDCSSQDPNVQTLRDYGYQVSVARSVAEVTALVRRRWYDAALVDLRFASLGAGNLLGALRNEQAGLDVILMVTGGYRSSPEEQLRLGGYPLVTKPLKAVELQRLLPAARDASLHPPAAFDGDPSAPGFAGLVGTSEKMQRVRHLISKVAVQRHPVLILGESGTGKELVARAIHAQGPWRDEPFVPVDCGAFPPTLIESELFGYVKGAFTGANQSRQGLLAAAGKGTVFLDEIGELPIELQPRLLRALQEREIKPVGSNEHVRLEARMVAATNQDLEAAMQRGAFRKDLYFRLNVVSIKMPPLRDRKEDVPILVEHFLRRCAKESPVPAISDEIMGRLMTYAWPGNVRELENCVQRAVSLGSGPFVQIQDLPSSLLYHLSSAASSRQELSTLEALEQQAIRQALKATGGDRVRAAKLLGIGKTTIYRKLKEYGLEDLAAFHAEK